MPLIRLKGIMSVLGTLYNELDLNIYLEDRNDDFVVSPKCSRSY